MVHMPVWPIPPWQKTINYDLERIANLSNALGNIHLKLPPVIHVAGTNGKGSSSHMLAAILQLAGYKTGLYTSPHLIDFRERVKINGRMIPKKYVIDFVEKYKVEFEKMMDGNSFALIGEVIKKPVILIHGLNGKEIINLDLDKVVRAYRLTFKGY